MKTFGIMAFIFSLGAIGMVSQLKKTMETLKKDVEELNKKR